MGMTRRQVLKQRQSHGQRFVTMQEQAQLARADLADELEADASLVADAAEPPELEDYGDSEVSLLGFGAETPFDRDWLSPLPLITQLPMRARPLVRYRLDENLDLHALDRREENESLRHVVARAVAEHLRRSGVSIRRPGDWCQVPVIPGDKGLLELVADDQSRARLARLLPKVGIDYKLFGIMLPGGDVITPQTLLYAARKEKRATRAAALRLAAARPAALAGEPWTPEDWDKFEETQRKKQGGKAKRSKSLEPRLKPART